MLSLINLIYAQQEQENTLRWFQGGTVNLDFSIQTDLFCGIGGKANTGCISLDNDVSSIFWNPAQLVLVPQRQVMVDISPPFRMNIANYYDVPTEVKNTVDNAILDYRTDETSIDYPRVTPIIYHRGRINSAFMSVPISKLWTVGFGYSKAMDIQFNMIGNELSSLLETRKELGTQTMIVKFRTDIDINFQFHTQINRMSFSFAKKWSPQWSTGVTVDRYFGSIYVDGKFMIDGIMETAGNEFAFNDPYDQHINFEKGEQNDLNQSIYTLFEGKGWGIKIGGLFHSSKKLSLGAMLEIVPTITFNGDMEVNQNIIPALNSDALIGESDEEIMDPAKLDLAKLTLTVPYENPTADECKLQFPSSFNLGIAYQWGFLKGNLNLTKYFGEFSFYTLQTTRGAKFSWSLKTGFNFNHIQLSLGIIALDEVRRGTDNDGQAQKNILLPQLSIGVGFDVNKNYRTETLLFLAPTPVFKEVVLFSF